jgi:SAM-dependent methyltransferase
VTAAEWDARYAAALRLFSEHADVSLVDRAGTLRPGTALDVGAGEGRNSLWLAARGWDVTAVDISAVALERLRGAAADQGLAVHTEVRDVLDDIGGGSRFDLVVVANMHVPPQSRRALFEGSAAAVAPGGHLFLVGHHVDSLGVAGPPDPQRLYTAAMMDEAFPGLDVLSVERRTGAPGDTGEAGVDLVVWARRP